MLTLVATPIGNLSDISDRALQVLRDADIILCEDTRTSAPLLKKYEISGKTRSYHKFNEAKSLENLLEAMRSGSKVALISDAGTPAISDPGALLVKACHEEEIPLSAVPGPCSAVMALTLSGLNTERFQFTGFLPKKRLEKTKLFLEFLDYPGTTIMFESPERILETLELLRKIAPERLCCIARELTKKFEEVRRGIAETLLTHFEQNKPRGEIVLMIEGSPSPDWSSLTPEEHIAEIMQEFSLSEKEALKVVANLRGIQKRLLYARQKKIS